ncbi:helix-turn-helix domain-containing protein [Natrinema salaciae]|uniref:HTH DNA binding domain n=1 Tax=Natrinema salaciae TaxID=1186196 RepID=A0A1H9RQ47_9EURY|nr:helix-turn-helix domain-containing protein [Natrinema salaciae]SER74678.1 HTH DNA binding domain [Natrinema salaciae]
MAIVAEILLSERSLPLVGLARSIPSGEISLPHSIPLESWNCLMVSVDADSREAFERELDAQDEIRETTTIGKTGDGWFYQVFIDGDSLRVDGCDPDAFEGALLEATITGDGWRERKVFADYDAFTIFRDRCELNDLPVELLSIDSDPDDPDERTQFGLTDRQYTALTLAFSRGYYDSPRRTSTAQLADELDISAASVSNLLRRAEHQLVKQTLGPDPYINGLTA